MRKLLTCNTLFFFLLLVLLLQACNKITENPRIWYRQPAWASIPDDKNGWVDDREWTQALPLGNGYMGAMVFGDIPKERIQLNEKTLWSGSPDQNDNPKAFEALPKIRQLLFQGNYKQATDLTLATQVCSGYGSGQGNGANVPYGSFQTLGDLWIESDSDAEYSDYHRELDLMTGIARISWKQKEIRFERELFASYPDRVIVCRIASEKKDQINLRLSMTRPERFSTQAENGQLVMKGTMDNGKGGDGMRYIALVKPILTG